MRLTRLLAPLAIASLLGIAGCSERAIAPCLHPPPAFGDGGPPDLGPIPQVCRHIYVVDEQDRFAAFDPTDYTFTDIGILRCPVAILGATPFSMSVARDNTAWVLYNTGELFHVDIRNAACFATAFDARQAAGDYSNFGMGFSSDTPGSAAETLFIAGTPQNGSLLGRLATLDLTSMIVSEIAPVQGSPELTGTGQAELWGFSPATDPQIPYVAQIDKLTAELKNTFMLPRLAGTPSAWAFAFWGGDFFIFLQRSGGTGPADPSTVVYRLGRADGKLDVVVANTRRTIVGAGVSSCAPVGLDH